MGFPRLRETEPLRTHDGCHGNRVLVVVVFLLTDPLPTVRSVARGHLPTATEDESQRASAAHPGAPSVGLNESASGEARGNEVGDEEQEVIERAEGSGEDPGLLVAALEGRLHRAVPLRVALLERGPLLRRDEHAVLGAPRGLGRTDLRANQGDSLSQPVELVDIELVVRVEVRVHRLAVRAQNVGRVSGVDSRNRVVEIECVIGDCVDASRVSVEREAEARGGPIGQTIATFNQRVLRHPLLLDGASDVEGVTDGVAHDIHRVRLVAFLVALENFVTLPAPTFELIPELDAKCAARLSSQGIAVLDQEVHSLASETSLRI